jgi:hypothetical protein
MTASTTSITESESESESSCPAPITYKIHSREHYKRSYYWSLALGVVPIIAVVIGSQNSLSSLLSLWTTTFSTNPIIIYVGIFAATGLIIYYAYYLLTTFYSQQTRDVELSVTICPLGIQRSKTTTTARNKRTVVHYYPLLPLESVKDCILVEHVGAFSVTTHVMIRATTTTTKSSKSKSESNDELVSFFPNVTLSFDRCHVLVQQIQRSLEKVR